MSNKDVDWVTDGLIQDQSRMMLQQWKKIILNYSAKIMIRWRLCTASFNCRWLSRRKADSRSRRETLCCNNFCNPDIYLEGMPFYLVNDVSLEILVGSNGRCQQTMKIGTLCLDDLPKGNLEIRKTKTWFLGNHHMEWHVCKKKHLLQVNFSLQLDWNSSLVS